MWFLILAACPTYEGERYPYMRGKLLEDLTSDKIQEKFERMRQERKEQIRKIYG